MYFNLHTDQEMYQFISILFVYLIIYKAPYHDCQENKCCFSNTVQTSVNLLNSNREKLLDEPQKVNHISVDEVHLKLWDGNTYTRKLCFKGFGASFTVYLKRHSLFHRDVLLNVGDQSLGILDVRNYLPALYVGIVDNSQSSSAFTKITREELELIIHLGNKTFSIECSYDVSDNSKGAFKFLRDSLHNCLAYRWQRPKLSKLVSWVDTNDSYSKKYKHFLNKAMPPKTDSPNEELSRPNRSLSSSGVTGNCVIKLVADHYYFEHVGHSDISKTVAEMVVSLAEADIIFRQTDFDGDGAGDNVGFKIGNITIYKNYHSYKMKDEDLDVFTYLDKFSEYDFSDFCLGVAYTYRDFEDNVVGLAWVGSSNMNGPAGGICQRRLWYRPERKYYSYNTALITQLSNGQFLPSHSAGLTLAHEFGHCFGSSHDDKNDPACSPGGNYGNYVMYPYTNDGSLANNRRFSSCSISFIYPVLVNKSPVCFQEDPGPVCGNSIVEDGEECDCGDADMCSDIDPCCTPKHNSTQISDMPCTIRRSVGFQCSPVTAACCTPDCKYHNSSTPPQCRPRTECTSASICETESFTCPAPFHHPDGTLCNSGRKICREGRCSLSVCRSLGLLECQCSRTLRDACYVCCIASNITDSVCSPISTYSSDKTDIAKQKGDACYNYQGFCDEAAQCILKESSTVDGLNKFLSAETAVNLGVWFKKYWYYIIVGIIVATTLAVIVSVLFRPKQDEHLDAMRLGKLAALLSEAERQKATYTDKMTDTEVAIQNIIEQINCQHCPMAQTQAVARLSVFFPTAPISLLTKSVQSSSSEEVAVKMLLVRNYPMQKFSISVQTVDEHSSTLPGPNKNDSEFSISVQTVDEHSSTLPGPNKNDSV